VKEGHRRGREGATGSRKEGLTLASRCALRASPLVLVGTRSGGGWKAMSVGGGGGGVGLGWVGPIGWLFGSGGCRCRIALPCVCVYTHTC
jgi:hypothetical protein